MSASLMDHMKSILKTADLIYLRRAFNFFCLGAVYSYPLKLLWFFRIWVKAQGGVFLPCKKPFLRLQFAPIFVIYYLFVIVVHNLITCTFMSILHILVALCYCLVTIFMSILFILAILCCCHTYFDIVHIYGYSLVQIAYSVPLQ